MTAKKKICIATATRAEYGLLKPLIEELCKESSIIPQLLVTGTHLSPEFGLTYRQIEKDGFVIDEKVEMLLSSDTPVSIVKSMGLGLIGFSEALSRLSPDILVILGDRYEMLSLASTALILRIPIAHIHGGEITEGAYDDSIRHAITKMSVLHFASTPQYRQRIIQMGEQPEFVHYVGAIGLDNFKSLTLLSLKEVVERLGISLSRYNFLVTFHPETMGNEPVENQFRKLLMAISEQEESTFIFTGANADTNGRIINQMIDKHISENPNKAYAFSSLGTLNYLSLMKHVTAVVGNSSSGIVEAPSAPTATINIGNRQKGRIQAESIVNCECETKAILTAFELVKSSEFRSVIDSVANPYDNGIASMKIVEVLKQVDLQRLSNKFFYDIVK